MRLASQSTLSLGQPEHEEGFPVTCCMAMRILIWLDVTALHDTKEEKYGTEV
jgi:hypothetical protein